MVLVNIYITCEGEAKRRLWGELEMLKDRSVIRKWCLLEDFNSVHCASEREGVEGIRGGGGGGV